MGASLMRRNSANFFSMKMSWLSKLCRDPFVTDRQFRVAYSLIVNFLSNESFWCCPSDRVLGDSVAKSERTTGEITRQLEGELHLIKNRRRGSSLYEFSGLTFNFGTPPSEVACDGTINFGTPPSEVIGGFAALGTSATCLPNRTFLLRTFLP